MRGWASERLGAAAIAVLCLAGAGCVLVLLGTFLPYVAYPDGGDYAVLDVHHLGTTWPYGLSPLAAIAAAVAAATMCRWRGRALGALLGGIGLVLFLDFLGAYVIGPTTSVGSIDLQSGGVLGSIGSGLLVAAGIVALRAPAQDDLPTVPAARPDTPRRWGSRSAWLVFVFAAIGVNALVGIAAVVFGDFGSQHNLEVKGVGSSMCLTLAAFVDLACLSALRRGLLKPLPLLGLALSSAGFGLLFAGIWGQWSSTQFWKITATLVVAAAACAWASLVSLVRLEPLHPLRAATLVAVLAFGVTSIAAVWALSSSSAFWRVYGTLGLTLAATTIATVVAGGSRTRAERTDVAPVGLTD